MRSSVRVSSSGSRGAPIVVGTRARQLPVPGGWSGTSALTGARQLMSRILYNSQFRTNLISIVFQITTHYSLLRVLKVVPQHMSDVLSLHAGQPLRRVRELLHLPTPLTQIVQKSPIFYDVWKTWYDGPSMVVSPPSVALGVLLPLLIACISPWK